MQLPLMVVILLGSNLYSKLQLLVSKSTFKMELATKLQRTHSHFTDIMILFMQGGA